MMRPGSGHQSHWSLPTYVAGPSPTYVDKCIQLGAVLLLVLTFALPTGARTYFVDSNQPNDTMDGMSPSRAWSTLAPLRRTRLFSGDSVLLRRGGLWRNSQFVLRRHGIAVAPIVLSCYGPPGLRLPRIQDTSQYAIGLQGNALVVESLSVSGARRYAISTLGGGLTDIEIRHNEIHGSTNGILLSRACRSRIVGNRIHSITYNRSNIGAIGVTLDQCEGIQVSDNTFRHCIGSDSGKSDGGAIEIFRSNRRISIDGNRAYDTWGFVEMGGLEGDSIHSIHISNNTAINTRIFAWFNLDTPEDKSNHWGVGYDSILLQNNSFIQNHPHKSSAIGANVMLARPNQIRVERNLFTGDSLFDFVYKGGFERGGNMFWSKMKKVPTSFLRPGEIARDPKTRIDTITIRCYVPQEILRMGYGACGS